MEDSKVSAKVEDDVEEKLEQPEEFELELDLIRWVKLGISGKDPPVMVKPAGPVTVHYGLDSKSRWREAVCLMMLLVEPDWVGDEIEQLGRRLSVLFRQDQQLWAVKARQLATWTLRGLINVKLLDRTLTYFQDQSSWLKYIKTLRKPLPKIESPGFPGTQWNEFYWKDQTAMALMQEADYPEGKNPQLYSKLFKEEAGKWHLKMEQFKLWIEKGKHDPLPEYYGAGKKCVECGLFLWDQKSFTKHMKRNHGYKVKSSNKQKEKWHTSENENDGENDEKSADTSETEDSKPYVGPFNSNIRDFNIEASPKMNPYTYSETHDSDSEKSISSQIVPLRQAFKKALSPIKKSVSKSSRKQVTCPECPFRCSPNSIIKHIHKHHGTKKHKESTSDSEMTEPETTPQETLPVEIIKKTTENAKVNIIATEKLEVKKKTTENAKINIISTAKLFIEPPKELAANIMEPEKESIKITKIDPMKIFSEKASFSAEPPKVPVEVNPKEILNPVNSESRASKHSLRKGKMIPCPLCGVEYAIASNLEKHIDQDHREDGSKPRGRKRKIDHIEKSIPITKTPVFVPVEGGDPAPTVGPITSNIDSVLKPTEYEIFQSLSVQVPKTVRKRVECPECGIMIPPNTIKRHLLKHSKKKENESLGLTSNLAPLGVPAPPKKKKIQCTKCDLLLAPNVIKRHMLKHGKEKKVRFQKAPVGRNEFSKETPGILSNLGSEESNLLGSISGESTEKTKLVRKKIPCEECGLLCAANTIQRHLDKHKRKLLEEHTSKNITYSQDKKYEMNFNEIAPIEITPKKDFGVFSNTISSPPSSEKKKGIASIVLKLHDIKSHSSENAKQAEPKPKTGIDEVVPSTSGVKMGESRKKQSCPVKLVQPVKPANQSHDKKADIPPVHKAVPEQHKKVHALKAAVDEKTAGSSSEDSEASEVKSKSCFIRLDKVGKASKEVSQHDKSNILSEESEDPLSIAVRKVVGYKMTPKQALSIYNLTPKALFDSLLGETEEDRMNILTQVNLSNKEMQEVITYCTKNEEQLSYKAVISFVKSLKRGSGNKDFTLRKLEAYRWWYAFRKKFDLKITAKKK